MKKTMLKTHFVYSLLFVLLIALDRVTKNWASHTLIKQDIDVIPDVLCFHYLENAGAAWGILQNAIWLFAIITIVVLGVMIYFYSRVPFETKYHYFRFTIILLSAGAIGNFIDRILWHYVVDFIYIKAIRFPVFNVADCFVCIGALCLIHCLLFVYKDDKLC